MAIIRFKTIDDSTSFLGSHPIIEINDASPWLEFGFEHSEDDWTCKYCHNINFQNRDVCFKCSKRRSAAPVKLTNEGWDDISTNPTRFLLLRNIDDHLSAQAVPKSILSAFVLNLFQDF